MSEEWAPLEEKVNYSYVIPVGTKVKVTGRVGKITHGMTGVVVESWRQTPSNIGVARVLLSDGVERWFETKELRRAP